MQFDPQYCISYRNVHVFLFAFDQKKAGIAANHHRIDTHSKSVVATKFTQSNHSRGRDVTSEYWTIRRDGIVSFHVCLIWFKINHAGLGIKSDSEEHILACKTENFHLLSFFHTLFHLACYSAALQLLYNKTICNCVRIWDILSLLKTLCSHNSVEQRNFCEAWKKCATIKGNSSEQTRSFMCLFSFIFKIRLSGLYLSDLSYGIYIAVYWIA